MYEPKKDDLFSLCSKECLVDSSTNSRFFNKLVPISGWTAVAPQTGYAPALNSNGQNITQFTFNINSNSNMRWDNLVMAVSWNLTTAPNSTTIGTNVCPSWNSIISNIQSLKLDFNGTTIYESMGNTATFDYMARLFKYKSYSALNQDDGIIFPITSPLDATITATSGYAYAKSQTTGFTNAQIQRIYNSQCNITGRNSVNYIYLKDLFPRLNPEMTSLNNLRTINIEIKWASNQVILESISGATGSFNITKCEIYTDEYTKSTEMESQILKYKLDGKSENILQYHTAVYQRIYSGADILIPSVKNLEAVFILSSVYGLNNTNSTSTCCSTGELSLGLIDGSSTLANSVKFADQVNGNNNQIYSAQIKYGEIIYPNYECSSIATQVNSSSGFYELVPFWNEYNKCIGSRMKNNGISYDVYRSILPVMAFKPFSDNEIHLSPAQDLWIKLKGGNGVSGQAQTKLYIVVFTSRVISLNADQSVQIIY
jgi:hypothetical protein